MPLGMAPRPFNAKLFDGWATNRGPIQQIQGLNGLKRHVKIKSNRGKTSTKLHKVFGSMITSTPRKRYRP